MCSFGNIAIGVGTIICVIFLYVLSEYFSKIDYELNENCLSSYQLFKDIELESINLLGNLYNNEKYIPYEKNNAILSTITFDQLTLLFEQRRSVRWYDKKPIPRNLIEKAINIAALAPSACNRQPFNFHYIDEHKEVKSIAELAMGTKGFSDNLPAIFVITGDLSAYPYERDRHIIYIDASLAAMQLMLALETLGLSTCPINWPDIESRELGMQKKLGLSIEERPVMLLSVGYAKKSGKIPFSQKKDSSLLLKYHS